MLSELPLEHEQIRIVRGGRTGIAIIVTSLTSVIARSVAPSSRSRQASPALTVMVVRPGQAGLVTPRTYQGEQRPPRLARRPAEDARLCRSTPSTACTDP
jgi:hypothetical protein